MPKRSDGYSRVFDLVLYPEDASQLPAIELLKSSAFQSVGILHDKDCDEKGELIKSHYHFVLKFKNQRSIKAVAEELSIAENYVQVAGSFEDSCRYLTHANAPDKFQYPDTDLVGTLVSAAKKVISYSDENIAVCAILDYIYSVDSPLSTTDLVRYCCQHGLWSELRRGGAILQNCLHEHNQQCSKCIPAIRSDV